MRKPKGFTLIELLVVIAIISVIAVLIMLKIGNSRGKAQFSAVKSDTIEMGKSIELFKKSDSVMDGSVILNTAAGPDRLNSDSPSGIGYLNQDIRALFVGKQEINKDDHRYTYGILIQKPTTEGLEYEYKTNKVHFNREPSPACYYFAVSGLREVYAEATHPIFAVVNGTSENLATLPVLPDSEGPGNTCSE